MSGSATSKSDQTASWEAAYSNSNTVLVAGFALTVLLMTVLRGIRFPNMWSYSHFLFNYETGFIKRGLIGEIVRQSGIEYLTSYEFFVFLSVAVLIANIALIGAMIYRLLGSKDLTVAMLALTFASSLAIVFLSHTIGYFGQIGLLATLAIINLSGFTARIIVLLISFPILLLIHEGSLVLFFPVAFVAILLSIRGPRDKSQVMMLGAVSALLAALTAFISNHDVSKSQTDAMFSSLQEESEHPLRKDAFDVLSRSSADNFDVMMALWPHKSMLIPLSESLLVTAPIIAIFCYATYQVLESRGEGVIVKLLSIAASLSPMLMHLAAWDMHRWNTLAVTSSFLVFYVAFTSFQCRKIPGRTNLVPALIFLTFLNAMSSIDLFDGYRVKQFPFFEHQKYIQDVLSGEADFPHVPSV